MEKDYYILVNGKKVEVSEEVYKSYWQLTNRENYLKRLDAEYNVLPFSSFGDYEYDILDKLADKSIDIEKIVETRELLKLLELALSKLNDEEYTLISDLYFKELICKALCQVKTIKLRKY
ncbi:TPA: sigma-70 family RNA polymerase sigma factor [Streptococcus suis]